MVGASKTNELSATWQRRRQREYPSLSLRALLPSAVTFDARITIQPKIALRPRHKSRCIFVYPISGIGWPRHWEPQMTHLTQLLSGSARPKAAPCAGLRPKVLARFHFRLAIWQQFLHLALDGVACQASCLDPSPRYREGLHSNQRSLVSSRRRLQCPVKSLPCSALAARCLRPR
jgi:hypothetical protein